MSDFNLFGSDLFGNPVSAKADGVLSKRFIVPPFSVLNTREGIWQDRKRAWIACGIESELGRGAKAFNTEANIAGGKTGVSVFDPTLTELCYTWFAPHGGQIVDPFAGGSVRGMVASFLGFKYWGCDLREEQIAANKSQAANLDRQPELVCGDSMDELRSAPDADFVFSCPPYGDLEVYSDDPRDISTLEYHTFIAAYRRIILRACERLKQNRFACFVVGDFRDTKGHYRNFVGDTVESFRQCGLGYYNEMILVNPCGTLPQRVTGQFDASRKIGKTHQNVLVFVKGDAKEATKTILASGGGA